MPYSLSHIIGLYKPNASCYSKNRGMIYNKYIYQVRRMDGSSSKLLRTLDLIIADLHHTHAPYMHDVIERPGRLPTVSVTDHPRRTCTYMYGVGTSIYINLYNWYKVRALPIPIPINPIKIPYGSIAVRSRFSSGMGSLRLLPTLSYPTLPYHSHPLASFLVSFPNFSSGRPRYAPRYLTYFVVRTVRSVGPRIQAGR